MNFIARWLVAAIATGVAVWLVPGVDLMPGSSTPISLATFSLIFSLINISIKPVLQIISVPVTVLTLGIFYLIVNTLMLYLAAWASNGIFDSGIVIVSFGSAFVAAILISIVSAVINAIIEH